MLSPAELYRLYVDRQTAASPDGSAMLDIAMVYDGDQVVRLSEIDKVSESSSPNLVAQGIDQYARYTASARPEIESFPLRPGIASSRRDAAKRVRVIKAWHENSMMALADYQRFRYYFGYGAMPAVIRPDPRDHAIPRWEIRSPMGVLPGPRDLPYSPEVPDCFTVTQKSIKWVADNYGVVFDRNARPDALLDVVEYNDAEQCTIFCVGHSGKIAPYRPREYLGDFGLGTYGGYWSERGTHIERLGDRASGRWLTVLSSTPNLTGMCLVSAPGVISLSRVTGFVNGILSRHHLHARLTALTVQGIAKGILPDEWIEQDPSNNGQGVVREADGLRGIRGILDGAKISVPQISPSYLTMPLLDRLEAWSRSDSGITASLGGESGENIRTRARGEALDSMVIDPRVEEAHKIAEAAREHEHRIAIAWAKTYGGSRTISVYVPGRKSSGLETYSATETFDTDQTQVRYPVPGVNTSGLLIGAAQSLGTRMMSLDEARRLNPLIEDPVASATGVWLDQAREVIMANLQTVMEASPEDGAWAVKQIAAGETPEDVWEGVQRRVQERQATAGPPGAPDGVVAPGTPEAQPGLGLPGVADQPTPIPEPPPGPGNLARLLTQSRLPAMTVPAERAG